MEIKPQAMMMIRAETLVHVMSVCKGLAADDPGPYPLGAKRVGISLIGISHCIQLSGRSPHYQSPYFYRWK